MSAYTDFVKAHYTKVKHLPQKERFAALAKMWHSQKGGDAQGKGLFSDIAHGVGSAAEIFGLGMDMKKKRTRKAKGGVLTAAGLEMPKKAKKMRKTKGGEMDTGAGFLSTTLGMLGL